MAELVRAKEPFRFYTRLHLTEATGLWAATLEELLALIKKVPEPCIYHHTHRFLQQHINLSPEPPNDFAYWAVAALGEYELGEMLASIDTVQFSTLAGLREKIATTITDHLKKNQAARARFARSGEEFYFMKSVSFILPTKYLAYDLKEFADALDVISIDSIYFHIFEARLRLAKKPNDFSNWIETSLGDKKIANEIARLDPYTYTIESLRKALAKIITRRIGA